jgi:hypothetical protein
MALIFTVPVSSGPLIRHQWGSEAATGTVMLIARFLCGF